jgi:hypothetical protein
VAGEKEYENEQRIRRAWHPGQPQPARELQVMRDELHLGGYEAYF